MRKLLTQTRFTLASILLVLIVLLAAICGSVASPASESITLKELLAKHLEAIGPASARGSAKTRIISGASQVVFRTPPPGQATGRALLASDGGKTLIAMSFPSPVYRREQFSFDGRKFGAAFITPGVRSSLGSFLMNHSVMFKEGLMGGTLSSAWPLLDLEARGPHLEYAGRKNAGGQILHEVRYLVRGGSDLKISLFFNHPAFEHVRTVYERVIAAQIGDRTYANIQERDTRYTLVEEFSEFRTEGGLNLPHTYRIKLSIDNTGGTFLADWEMNLTEFTLNEPIDPQSFNPEQVSFGKPGHRGIAAIADARPH